MNYKIGKCSSSAPTTYVWLEEEKKDVLLCAGIPGHDPVVLMRLESDGEGFLPDCQGEALERLGFQPTENGEFSTY